MIAFIIGTLFGATLLAAYRVFCRPPWEKFHWFGWFIIGVLLMNLILSLMIFLQRGV